jgi:L-threonine kinase
MELTGRGFCHGSFGELLQGVLPGNKKFLINLKTCRASRVRVHITSNAYSTAKEAQFADSYRRYAKSYKVVRNILVDIGRHDDCYLEIDSDIPVGKGCSSSTADMVASVDGLAAALSLALKPQYVGRMLTEIEPNDGLHHPGTSAYHHTSGELIARFDFVPAWEILGVDFGGTVDTVEFNRREFAWSDAETRQYAELLERALTALSAGDAPALCEIATASTMLWQRINPKPRLDGVLQLMRDTGGLGVANTHSGTYVGILYERNAADLDDLACHVRAAMTGCDVQRFSTVSCAASAAGAAELAERR